MAKGKDKGVKLWNFVDNLEGDKVVWMIVLLLMLVSIVAIFSSTSLLAIQQNTSRMAIMKEQLLISALGLGLIILCYNIKSIKFFRIVSQAGYVVSIALLLFLSLHIQISSNFRALFINQAWRAIRIGGFQLQVYEVVKVAMVMYLAWAVDTYNKDGFTIANALAKNPSFAFLKKDIWKKIIYIYFPIFSVCLCIMTGSLSSTLFIGAIMFFTILIGGLSIKELVIPGLVAAGLLLGCIAIDKVSSKPIFPHLESALNRLEENTIEKNLDIIRTSPKNSIEFRWAMDKIQQPMSARIAVKEGGFIGKGPGRSTQRYVVPVMFEDYMFSFIIEEYGLIGAIIILILYISLMARGSMIVRGCDGEFAKTAVAGLVMLITAQAMMHMFINVGIGPLTGQTLPMVSHGNSSFLMFSIAFGIILSVSRIAKRRMDKETAAAQPLTITHDTADEVGQAVAELDGLDNL